MIVRPPPGAIRQAVMRFGREHSSNQPLVLSPPPASVDVTLRNATGEVG